LYHLKEINYCKLREWSAGERKGWRPAWSSYFISCC